MIQIQPMQFPQHNEAQNSLATAYEWRVVNFEPATSIKIVIMYKKYAKGHIKVKPFIFCSFQAIFTKIPPGMARTVTE